MNFLEGFVIVCLVVNIACWVIQLRYGRTSEHIEP